MTKKTCWSFWTEYFFPSPYSVNGTIWPVYTWDSSETSAEDNLKKSEASQDRQSPLLICQYGLEEKVEPPIKFAVRKAETAHVMAI